MRRAWAAALASLLLICMAPSSALADGDPASDVLIGDTIFFPYQAPSADTARKLRGVVDATRKAGQPVRVAIIHGPQDLGTAANLYGHPREYARLLSQELGNPVEPGKQGHREELIVVMAAGFGTIGVPPKVDSELRKLELPGNEPDTLASAAGYGVQELARATGHPVHAAFDKPEGGSGSGGLTVVLIVLALVALVAVLIVLRVRSAAPASPEDD